MRTLACCGCGLHGQATPPRRSRGRGGRPSRFRPDTLRPIVECAYRYPFLFAESGDRKPTRPKPLEPHLPRPPLLNVLPTHHDSRLRNVTELDLSGQSKPTPQNGPPPAKALMVPMYGHLPCSWLAVDLKRARDQAAVVNAIWQSGGWVRYDWQFGGPIHDFRQDAQPPEPPWLRRTLGADFFGEVEAVLSDRVAPLENLKHLESLILDVPEITEAKIGRLRWLTQLREAVVHARQFHARRPATPC